MHIKTLTAMSILLMSVAACGNPKPVDPVVTTPPVEATTVPDAAMPGNDVGAMPPDATNAVPEPAPEPAPAATTTNGVAPPADEPRGLPDRR